MNVSLSGIISRDEVSKARKRGIFKEGNQQGGWARLEGFGAFIAVGPLGVFGIGAEGKKLFYKEGSYKAANVDAYNQGAWQELPGAMPTYVSSGKRFE